MSNDLNLPTTNLEQVFLRTLCKLNASEKASYFLYIELLYGQHSKSANDAVFIFQTVKKTVQNRSKTLHTLPIGNRPLDKIDHLIAKISTAYQEITRESVGLIDGLSPQRYASLKTRLSEIIER